MEVELGAVERTVACIYLEASARLYYCLFQNLFGKPPVFFIADVRLGHGGKLDAVFEPEERIDLVEELGDILYLILHLFPAHENMRIVLCEAADSEKTVQSARKLVSVNYAELSHSHREFPVGMRLGIIIEHAARAVHGFYRIVLFIYCRGVHIVFIVLPVPGTKPKIAV